jgi:NADH-quinone oxidoreductase subunit L
VLNEAHEVPYWVKWSPFFAMILGFVVAFWFYIVNPSLPRRLADRSQRPLYQFLLNKWYFDEVFDFLFVRPARWLGRTLWKGGDGAIIDGGINGLATGPDTVLHPSRSAARRPATSSTYAFAMVLGIVVLDDLGHAARRGLRPSSMDNLLSIITFLPLVAAVILARVPARR